MDFSSQLRAARISAGLTQRQVAEAMGITNSTYCGYETGKREPDVAKIKQLSKILAVPADELLDTGISQKDTPPLSERAIKMARAFEELDEKGKALLEDSLAREEKRMEMEAALNAYAKSFTPLRIYKTPVTDKTGIDLAEKPELKMIQITTGTPEKEASIVRQVMLSENPFGIRFCFDDGSEAIWAVDTDKTVEPGSLGLFTIDGKSFLKRLESGWLYPLQAAYDPIPLPDMLQCAGRVIGLIRNVSISDIYGTLS